MDKDFELLLKIISKGTINTLQEFDLFWNEGCINDDWTKLYLDVYGYDDSGKRGQFYIDISSFYDDFKEDTMQELEGEYDYETALDKFERDFDVLDFINYIENNYFKNENDGFEICFYNFYKFDEFLKDNCENDFEKYLLLDRRCLKITDKDNIQSYQQEECIKIRDFLDNFASND